MAYAFLLSAEFGSELIDGGSRVWCSLRGLVSSRPGAIYRKLTLAIPSSMEHFSLIEQTGGEWIGSYYSEAYCLSWNRFATVPHHYGPVFW